MNKTFACLLVLGSVLVSCLCYAAWRPVVPPAPVEEPVPAREGAPVVLETSAVLVLADRPQEAPKARPVAARAKTWQCGAWEASQAGGAYKRCDWR